MKKKKNTFFKDLKHYFENQEGPDMLDILPTREQVKQYIRQMKQYKNK